MKKIRILSIATVLSHLASPSHASGVPTVDLGAIVQLQQQYQQLKQQYEAITGKGSYGGMGYNEAILSATVVPGSWQDVVARQATGAYGTSLDYYESRIHTLPLDQIGPTDAMSTRMYGMNTDAVRSSFASGDLLYGQIQTHVGNIARLGHEVDSTENIKQAQDLRNRIATEEVLLQTATAKLQALNVNIQANMLNSQNQAQAANARFYQWD